MNRYLLRRLIGVLVLWLGALPALMAGHGIRENQLPQASIVLFCQLSFWDQYKLYVIGVTAIVTLQTVIIGGLVLQRKRQRRAETSLQESERRFRLVADTAPVLIWMAGTDKLCTYFNKPWLDFTGRSLEQEIGNGWAEAVHLDDLKSCLQTYTESFDRREKFRMKYRLRRNDGQYRWILDIGVPRFNEDGSFAGYIGSCIDVTDQKMAQESLEKVSGQLIAAHEEERSHLARELHDDICQRLAILSHCIEKATKSFGSPQKSTAEQLEQIWKQCSSLTADVQALSHELHPSILDNLGLVMAVRSFCREVSEQNGAVVEFAETDISSSLPREVSLSLFRVIQEALHNAAKYSGQKHFKVLLKGNANQIELEVSDQGAGFDLESMKNGRGLGLVSMAERIHLLNGRISIDSKPNVGTTVRAWVPLVTQPKAMTASAN